MIDEKILVDKLKGRKETVLCKENYLFGNVGVAHAEGFNRGLEYAIAVVNQLAEESNNGWIPCSERLPKEDEYVLCSLNENNPTIIRSVVIATYDGADYWHNGIIQAWQPLPAPFKPKGEQP